MAKFYKIEDIKRAAQGGWPNVLAGLGIDSSHLNGRHGPCPGCGGKDRFRFDDKAGDGTWICSGGGDMKSGDGVALVAHALGIEWKEAIDRVGVALGLQGDSYTPKQNTSGVAAKPQSNERVKINELYDEAMLRQTVAGVETVTPEWFIERSPIDPRGVMPGEFLDAVFDEGQRALIFTNFFSQGDFAWQVGKGGFRLGEHEGVGAVKSALPINGGKNGVWFLSNPVSLGWEPNPRKGGEKGRRCKECVTDWKYLVLESDDAPGELWLKLLAMFPVAIRAIYSSGGRSWHALVVVDRETWADMDGLLKGNPRGKSVCSRVGVKKQWAIVGADPGALTPVRLTRLPGCYRNGVEQRLIYLNPHPSAQHPKLVGGGYECRRIVDLVPLRKV